MKHPWFACLILIGYASLAVAAPTPLQSNKGPIEITSDTLEVDQNENVALFTGKVVAVQADMQLTADRMKVFYLGKSDPAEKPANTQQSISKIEVDGNVFMTTPTETARGLSGVYNAEKDELTLTGDVVLTKDKNVLKGASLVYDMGTGKSVLKNADGKPDRVRALFVPADKKVQGK